MVLTTRQARVTSPRRLGVMGGSQGGDVASTTALRSIRDDLRRALADVERHGARARSREVRASLVVELVRRANQGVRKSAAGDGETVSHTNGTGVGQRAALSGEITSRDDVVRALDKICDYYARHEPSSPLPLLLQRCKRLATMSFIEIVREMVPDGLSQVEMIAGKREE